MRTKSLTTPIVFALSFLICGSVFPASVAQAPAGDQLFQLVWQVSDTATRDLMAGYYRRLKAGDGRAEGFRQVQLEMLHSANYNHPYYWAGFIQSGAGTSLQGR